MLMWMSYHRRIDRLEARLEAPNEEKKSALLFHMICSCLIYTFGCSNDRIDMYQKDVLVGEDCGGRIMDQDRE